MNYATFFACFFIFVFTKIVFYVNLCYTNVVPIFHLYTKKWSCSKWVRILRTLKTSVLHALSWIWIWPAWTMGKEVLFELMIGWSFLLFVRLSSFFPCLMNWKRLILPITMSLKFLRLCSGSISRSLLATLNSCLLVPTWPLITSRSLKSLNIWFLELRMILLCLIFLMLDWKLFALKASPNWLRNSWSTTDSEPSKPRVFYNAGLHFFIILYFYFVVTSIDSIIISFTGLDNSPEDDNVFSVWAILSTTSIPDITWPNTV